MISVVCGHNHVIRDPSYAVSTWLHKLELFPTTIMSNGISNILKCGSEISSFQTKGNQKNLWQNRIVIHIFFGDIFDHKCKVARRVLLREIFRSDNRFV